MPHWKRVQKTGSPQADVPIGHRFAGLEILRGLIAVETDECILWPRKRSGYGQVQIGGVKYLTHRLACELANGESPGDRVVMHACDTPLCVNPRHLLLGTLADNSQDMHEKGRGRGRKCNHPGTGRCNICKAEYMAAWQKSNAEKVRAYSARYRNKRDERL